jgi:predicted small lipoprotein YifL
MRAGVLTGAALLLLLGGCGQKGPLYLPDKHPTAVTRAPAAPAPADAAPKKQPSDTDGDTSPPQ